MKTFLNEGTTHLLKLQFLQFLTGIYKNILNILELINIRNLRRYYFNFILSWVCKNVFRFIIYNLFVFINIYNNS